MEETLTQQRRVWEEGPLGCKPLLGGKNGPVIQELTVPPKKAPANYVPAAAVIRRGQALSGFTGCKGRVGGSLSQG